MEIQQGFVPMDEPELARRPEVSVPVAPPRQGSIAPHAPNRSPAGRHTALDLPPDSGRSARIRRNLIAVGLLVAALLAVRYWQNDSDEPRTAADKARTASSFGAPPPNRVGPVTRFDSEASAPLPNGTSTDQDGDASELDIVFSLAELTDVPPAPEPETPAFEPWSAQQPDPPLAGRARARPVARKRPGVRTGQAHATEPSRTPSAASDSPAAPAADRPTRGPAPD